MSTHWRKISHGLAYPKLTRGLPTLSLTTNSSWLPWGGLPCLSSALWCQYLCTAEKSRDSLFETGTPAQTGTGTLIVHLMDVNDNFPEFAENYRPVVYENRPPGQTVIRIIAEDRDTRSNGPPFEFWLPCGGGCPCPGNPSCADFSFKFIPGVLLFFSTVFLFSSFSICYLFLLEYVLCCWMFHAWSLMQACYAIKNMYLD